MKSRPSSTVQNYKNTLPFYPRWQESVKCERFFGRKCDYSVAILLLPVLSTLVYTPPLTHLMLFVLKNRSFHTVSLATAGTFSVCTQIIQSVFSKRIFGWNLLRDDFVMPTREQHRYLWNICISGSALFGISVNWRTDEATRWHISRLGLLGFWYHKSFGHIHLRGICHLQQDITCSEGRDSLFHRLWPSAVIKHAFFFFFRKR